MKKYFTFAFWDYAGERALKTAIQSLFVGGLIGGGLFSLDWAEIGSLTGGMPLRRSSLASSSTRGMALMTRTTRLSEREITPRSSAILVVPSRKKGVIQVSWR